MKKSFGVQTFAIHLKAGIRKNIGYISQKGGLEHRSTGLENMILQARLYGIMTETIALNRKLPGMKNEDFILYSK